MLAIRRLLNSCVLADCDQTEVSDGNKENSTVRHMNVIYRVVRRMSDQSGRALGSVPSLLSAG